MAISIPVKTFYLARSQCTTQAMLQRFRHTDSSSPNNGRLGEEDVQLVALGPSRQQVRIQTERSPSEEKTPALLSRSVSKLRACPNLFISAIIKPWVLRLVRLSLSIGRAAVMVLSWSSGFWVFVTFFRGFFLFQLIAVSKQASKLAVSFV